MTPASDCFRFEQETFNFTTTGPVHLNFTPLAFKLSGSLKLDKPEDIGFYVDGDATGEVETEFEEYSIWISN